ncbi:humps family-domain-containing protein [Chiua virens]|nr:humps family-domain-containing protein [Chiua virens]
MSPPHLRSYQDRIQNHSNPATRALLHVMVKKKTNLSVSVDVTRKKDFLAIIDAVGPYICLIKAYHFLFRHQVSAYEPDDKTHIDILEDYDPSVIVELQALSQKHEFLIFEDRKFADIGNTVALQYSSGIYKIASWAHITNAHAVPGPSIITGLASVGLPLERGLILLAEMSSKGSLATGAYTEDAVRMARARRDFVIGFIAQHRMEGIGARDTDSLGDEDFLILSPGVGLDSKGDAMGQQYRTPAEVVTECGCDVIIVGRGIFGTGRDIDVENVQRQAQRYQAAGWEAYEKRLAI